MSDTQETPPARRGRPPGSKNASPLEKARAVAEQNRRARVARGERAYPIRPGTKDGISRDVGLGMLMALNFGGQRWPDGIAAPPGIAPNAIEFWLKLKRTNPVKFAECLCRLIRPTDGLTDQTVTFIVQTLNVQGGPVAGVLASPIAEHVAPVRIAAPVTDAVVIEQDLTPQSDG